MKRVATSGTTRIDKDRYLGDGSQRSRGIAPRRGGETSATPRSGVSASGKVPSYKTDPIFRSDPIFRFRVGHLFQGRYKAFVIDKDRYLLFLQIAAGTFGIQLPSSARSVAQKKS